MIKKTIFLSCAMFSLAQASEAPLPANFLSDLLHMQADIDPRMEHKAQSCIVFKAITSKFVAIQEQHKRALISSVALKAMDSNTFNLEEIDTKFARILEFVLHTNSKIDEILNLTPTDEKQEVQEAKAKLQEYLNNRKLEAGKKSS